MKSIILAVFVFLFQQAAFANMKVKVHYSPLANLIYQLDCVSGELRHCSRATFKDLWKKEFSKKPEDEALIKAWTDLMARYRVSVDFEDSKKPVIAGRNEGLQLGTKIRIASFQSANMNEYFSRLDLVVVPSDREKFENVVRHFYPNFEKWWNKTALRSGRAFAKETEALLKRSDISKNIKQYAYFYEADLPENYEVHLSLFYRPDFDESTAGQQIENYSVAEFLPTEKPKDRIDVIIHELCHFFYRSSSDEKFVSLQKSFEAMGRAESKAAFNLMNETLATTFGNGIISKITMEKKKWEKHFAKPQSFYFNYHIDKAAKAILPWMEESLKEGRTLYDPQFVEKYVTILEKDFALELSAPRLMLNELVLVSDSQFSGKFRDVVRQAIRASSVYASHGEWSDERNLKSFKELPSLSALIIVHPLNVNQLREKSILMGSDFDLFKKSLKSNPQIIFSFKRPSNVPAYIISAPSYEEALKLVEKLGDLKAGFSGVLSL